MTSTSHTSDLRQPTAHITAHDASGKAIVRSSDDFAWQRFDDDKMAFSVLYTTSKFPANLNNEADIQSHQATMSGGLGLVNPNGTVFRCVDFAPGYHAIMHRTKSLDYGILIEGQIEMVLDSGDIRLMKRGDVAVQRGTMHQWRNPSQTEWARMMFVLQDSNTEDVGGEDLGPGLEGLPPSGN
ncbi:hypothetical protein BDV25DRAFT_45091 [Aspergillus avenaceus]|uniref:Cupin 2 conserved barrel domain-containing protein n=1 Tax=Aspergillus avenaceus TaxID=36643 RepID=A0A5N6U3E1_ASPAV|nr:hypothetical protein BDV25DRAFT_45091 [Aspergillus avenaceus]